jgi:hypothetical protein
MTSLDRKNKIDPNTDITWSIIAYVHGYEDGLKFRWSGGAYIDIIVNGIAVDVINVYDYAKGQCEIRTAKQFIRKIREYLREGGMNLG